MGTTAQKLEYLGTTKSQLKDMINYGLDEDNKITNSTTFRNYVTSIFNAFLEALRTPDTLFTNLPKKSGSGSNITLNDTANAPMRIELGASELTQETTIGKNLANIDSGLNASLTKSDNVYTMTKTSNSRFSNDITAVVSANTQVIFQYNVVSSSITPSTATKYLGIVVYYEDNTQEIAILWNAQTAGLKTTTFTPTKNMVKIRLYLDDGYDANSNIVFKEFMLSTSGGTYEEYTGGIASPNPSYPQDIHTISGSNTIVIKNKNLLCDLESGGINATTGATTTEAGTVRTKNYIDLSFSDKYKFTRTNDTTNIKCRYYDKDFNFLGTSPQIGSSTNYNLIPSSGARYLKITMDNSNLNYFTDYQCQLEIGNTATPYTPYVSQEADIDLKSRNLFDKSKLVNTTYNSSIATALSNYLSTGKYATGYCSNASSLSNNSIYVTTFTPIESGKTYTINNTYSATANFSQICFLDKDGNIVSNNTAWSNQAYTHTATSEEKYIMIGININDGGVDYRTYTMINEGSTALPYEDYYTYGEYCKIGNYENKFIRNSGKNIQSSTNLEQGWINTSGEPSTNTGRTRFKDYVEVESGESYYLSSLGITSSENWWVHFYDANKNWLSYYSATQMTQTNNVFTIPNNCKYIKGAIAVQDSTISNVMLAQSSTEVPYEPYGSNEWYKKDNIEKLDASTLNYEKYTHGTFGDYFRASTTSLNILRQHDFNTTFLAFCNKYKIAGRNSTEFVDYSVAFDGNSTKVTELQFKNSNYSTGADFKNSLDGTYLYYPVATPTYTKITGTLAEQLEYIYQKMLSQEGTTNISQVNNDLSFVINASAIEEA